jgi:hypothetical protein
MSMARPNFSQREMWRHDIQHDDIQHNDTQHNWLICDTRHKQCKQHIYPYAEFHYAVSLYRVSLC